jgi:hypothetical protein
MQSDGIRHFLEVIDLIISKVLLKTMQTLILKRPLLMAVFGLASMQQITYHMKVLPQILPGDRRGRWSWWFGRNA